MQSEPRRGKWAVKTGWSDEMAEFVGVKYCTIWNERKCAHRLRVTASRGDRVLMRTTTMVIPQAIAAEGRLDDSRHHRERRMQRKRQRDGEVGMKHTTEHGRLHSTHTQTIRVHMGNLLRLRRYAVKHNHPADAATRARIGPSAVAVSKVKVAWAQRTSRPHHRFVRN